MESDGEISLKTLLLKNKDEANEEKEKEKLTRKLPD